MTKKVVEQKEVVLKERLQEVEEILRALRNHEVDAVIGTKQVTMLRLREVEDQLQQQIQISENRLEEIESIYQNVPVGLCILDNDLKLVRINDHLIKIHGVSVNEHLGRTLGDILPDLYKDVEPALREVLETGNQSLNNYVFGEIPGKPEKMRYFLEHWLPLHDQDGNVTGINMVIDDITDRKKYEEKLQQLNTTLEERVAERTKVAEERAEKLREMALQMTDVEERERQRLARVLHDGLQQLLIGAKFNTKNMMGQISDPNVKEQLEEIIAIMDQAVESSRSLSYELSPPILHDHGLIAALHWLAGMRHMKGLSICINENNEIPKLPQNLKVFLFQVVRELLINVLKHAEIDKAEVNVSCEDEHIYIEVADEGKGFDVKKMVSGDSNSQGIRKIRKKLNLLNGELDIQSKIGKGSRFKLSVPLSENIVSISHSGSKNTPVLDDVEKITEPDSINKNVIDVLVVDDHQVMRNGLVRLLSKESDINIVGEAGNGIEAIEFVQNSQPDVVIMDITMPKMDGIEATRLIHQDYPDIQIVGLSMHEENEYTLRMKEAGAVGLLNKGGPSDQLFDAIRGNNNNE